MMAKAPTTPPDPDVEKIKQEGKTERKDKEVEADVKKHAADRRADKAKHERDLKAASEKDRKEEQAEANDMIDKNVAELRSIISFVLVNNKIDEPGVLEALKNMQSSVSTLATTEVDPTTLKKITKQVGSVGGMFTKRIQAADTQRSMDTFFKESAVVAAQSAEIKKRIANVLGSTILQLKPLVEYKTPEEIRVAEKAAGEAATTLATESTSSEGESTDASKDKELTFKKLMYNATVVPTTWVAKKIWERKLSIAVSAGVGTVFLPGYGTIGGAVVGAFIPPSVFSKKKNG